MTMTQTAPAMITEPQRRYIETLLDQRETTGTPYEGWEPNWATATRTAASQVITYLKTLPRREQVAAPAPEPVTTPGGFGAAWREIPVGGSGFGYYAIEEEHRVRFFRVKNSKGFVSLAEQASDSFFPVEPKGREFSYLTQIARDPQAAGMLYATTLGKCTRCARTLTDPESRERGMGPECAGKGGW